MKNRGNTRKEKKNCFTSCQDQEQRDNIKIVIKTYSIINDFFLMTAEICHFYIYTHISNDFVQRVDQDKMEGGRGGGSQTDLKQDKRLIYLQKHTHSNNTQTKLANH